MNNNEGQQLIRKLGDMVASALMTYGVFDATGATFAAGVFVAAANFGWWYWWNRKVEVLKK